MTARRPVRRQGGVTLIEAMVGIALIVIFFSISLRFLDVIKSALFQNLQVRRITEINRFNTDVKRSVRMAKRVMAVAADRLELESYDKSFPPTDRRWIEQTQRVVYRWDGSGATPKLVKEIFASTAPAAALLSRSEFLRDQSLITPDASRPFFAPKYESGGRVGAVTIEVRLRSPLFGEEWTPLPMEAALYGQGI